MGCVTFKYGSLDVEDRGVRLSLSLCNRATGAISKFVFLKSQHPKRKISALTESIKIKSIGK